jgi:hypothetical protein
MKKLLSISIVLVLFGCGQQANRQWKTIEIGNYLFDFPPDFKLEKEKGIDSYVGKIKGDSMWFGFDFGHYSDVLAQTPQEFLDKGYWRILLSQQFMKAGITYDNSNMPRVDILNIRQTSSQDSGIGKGCDYIATCRHEDSVFDYEIYLPDEIRQLNFMIDTVDNQFRKIVYSKNPHTGITGIYLRDLNSFNKSINNYKALSMTTGQLTKEQQAIALKIFSTGRYKNKNK